MINIIKFYLMKTFPSEPHLISPPPTRPNSPHSISYQKYFAATNYQPYSYSSSNSMIHASHLYPPISTHHPANYPNSSLMFLVLSLFSLLSRHLNYLLSSYWSKANPNAWALKSTLSHKAHLHRLPLTTFIY